MEQVRRAGKTLFLDHPGPTDGPALDPAVGARVAAAARALAAGDPVVVLDDDDREGEGDLVLSAALATPEWIAFMIRHTSGILCAPMTAERADALRLPPIVADNEERHQTAFTVSVDAVAYTTTGISAADRCRTVRVLADPGSRPEDLARPGHVFPLVARPGGVLERRGHTEAAVDLARIAGLAPVMVIAELMTPDGRVANRTEVTRFAAEHNLVSLTVADLVAYRLATGAAFGPARPGGSRAAERDREPAPAAGAADEVRGEVRLAGGVVEVARAALPTRYGRFLARLLRTEDGGEHLALVRGDVTQGEVLVRVHSECRTGDVLGSLRCDCGDQLATALRMIDHAGTGVLLYQLGHEGRGIGLADKLRAYRLQDQGLDTVDANLRLGLPVDRRDFTSVPRVLRALGVRRVRLLTNNPDKLTAVRRGGYPDARRWPLPGRPHPEARRYLATKRDRLGHLVDAALLPVGAAPTAASAPAPAYSEVR